MVLGLQSRGLTALFPLTPESTCEDGQARRLAPNTMVSDSWTYLGVLGLLTPDPIYCEVCVCFHMISTGNTAISILKWVLPFLVYGPSVFGI